jgi:hypothetical protein
MKCSNCDKEALYEYKITLKNSVFYCGKDLPKFLDARKRAGLLTLTEKHAEEKETAIAALSTETVVEKTLTEEEPAPKKKAAKKKAK